MELSVVDLFVPLPRIFIVGPKPVLSCDRGGNGDGD